MSGRRHAAPKEPIKLPGAGFLVGALGLRLTPPLILLQAQVDDLLGAPQSPPIAAQTSNRHPSSPPRRKGVRS